MSKDTAPPRKRSADAPPRDIGATDERTEQPLISGLDVNTPQALAWDEHGPTFPVPFDWDSVEDPSDRSAAEQFPADLVSRFPEMASFLRDIIETADASGALPTPRQVAVSWVALCFVLRLPFIENLSVRNCAAELGVSHEMFFRRVGRWAKRLNVPPPAAKPAGTGAKIAARLVGRHRGEKDAA